MKSSPARIRQYAFVGCGLSDKEALLYDTLLTLGEASGARLEHATGLRKNTYALIAALQRKNLLLPVTRERKSLYQPAPPDALLSLLKKQEESVKETRHQIVAILPSLSSQYQLNVGKPTIRFYEGETGLKEVYEDVYREGKADVWGCVDLETADTVFPAQIKNSLIPLRIKRRIRAWALLGDSIQARALSTNDEKQLRQSVIFDKSRYPLPGEIEVYEDKIAMMSFAKGKFIGIIIQNEDFARSLTSIFRWIFDRHGKKDGVRG